MGPLDWAPSADQIELLDRHGDLVADLFGKVIQQAHAATRRATWMLMAS